MGWARAVIVDGHVVCFEPGSSVNRENYLTLPKEKMWPSVRSRAQRNDYYYQQDGAPPHRATECLQFLEEHFPDHIISRKKFHPKYTPTLSLN